MLTITNSTISGNTGGAISNTSGTVMLRNATVSGGISSGSGGAEASSIVTAATLVDGECTTVAGGMVSWTSNGYNLESPGDTCGFDQTGDQVSVPDPMLGLLQNNGGPTETHALEEGSPAINQIPQADCGVTTDQRGLPRPAGPDPKQCDVGSFEVQPAP